MTWRCYSVSTSLPSRVIWTIVKIWVAAKNAAFKPVDVTKLSEDFSLMTMKKWASVCMHVKETEIYTENAHKVYNTLENNFINSRSSYSNLDTNHEDEDEWICYHWTPNKEIYY
jgi:hypothetical protein